MNRLLRHIVFLLPLVAPFAGSAPAADWPHWRGPRRNDVVAESSGWPNVAWLKQAPLWTKNLGAGSNSPLAVGERLYTLGWRNGKDTVVCLDATTGNEVWTTSYVAPEYGRFKVGDEGFYSGPCSTPEFDLQTGYLYTLGIDGDLSCWDTAARGRKVWGFNLYEKYAVGRRPKIGRSPQRDYGYVSTPLVHGDWLLVEVGARDGNLMAFDRRTGERRWTSKCADPAGHNGGPAPMVVEGVPCVAVLTIHRLVVVRLDRGHEGETIAEHPWETEFANNIAGPAVHGDSVLVTSAYNRNAICRLRISLKGAEKVWERRHASKVCTPVVHKGCVYWTWKNVVCLDWETGALKWEGGNFGDPGSCIVTGDDRLLVYGLRGKLALTETAERSPEKYTELAVRDGIFREFAWPHVIVAGGRVFCKDCKGNLACFTIGP